MRYLGVSSSGVMAEARTLRRLSIYRLEGLDDIGAAALVARAWSAAGLDVQVHFDNDVKVHAPFNAICLAEKLGVGPLVSPVSPPLEPSGSSR